MVLRHWTGDANASRRATRCTGPVQGSLNLLPRSSAMGSPDAVENRTLPRRDDGFFGRRRGRHPLDHDCLCARRRDEVEPFRQARDAPGRAQGGDLQAQVAVDLLLLRPLLLHLLNLVAVAQQLEVLPRREQQDHDQDPADRERAPDLALTLIVHLANDQVVAYVFLDRVLEVDRTHASLSIARSLALRARGLRATSASAGVTGLRVSTRRAVSPAASARNVCLTTRSSSEWKVMTASRAPARSRCDASTRKASRPSSSRLTQIRSAWKVRVAGSMRWYPRLGIARRTICASCAVVVTGASRRASTTPRAIRRENRSSPN